MLLKTQQIYAFSSCYVVIFTLMVVSQADMMACEILFLNVGLFIFLFVHFIYFSDYDTVPLMCI